MATQKKALYYRKGKQIMNAETGHIDTYPNVQEAKHVSAKLQRELDGHTGMGSVRVVKRFPEIVKKSVA